ncbi:MAG TPA: tRNA (N6-isopentenyl adenosine(37)-C2)-methylthiotransferase MiaB [Desulfobacterales bacterium]|nr:tRNA (N6-isopentenyl adenosine(37)-C2)-methylthiotransferase MiaB [Desulfobacterales bacterium]
MKEKRVHIVTMGCQMNVYDSEQMLRLLVPLNYRPTSELKKADLILLNTCSIREKAEHKVYSFLGRLVRVKRRRPHIIIGVGGCVAQQEGYRLAERAPHVDMVFGTFALGRLPSLIQQVENRRKQVVDIASRGMSELLCVKGPVLEAERATAFVTIMEGCDNFCTYCVVPYVRGRGISRKPEDIVEEIRLLVKNGIREVTLIGQNVNAYGQKNGYGCDFPSLLQRVNHIEGLRRVRFTTSHPKDLSDGLIEAFCTLDKLAPHIHLPVQSGSDRVLRRMNRAYTRAFYLKKVEKLCSVRPDIAITSDIIIGFPGEESVDFEATVELVRQVGFDSLFLFKYSDRPNVPAAKFSNKVPEVLKGERFSALLEVQREFTRKKNKALVGTTQDVLVEGPSKKSVHQLTGRTPCNRIVNFTDGADFTASVGQILPVRIVKAFSHSLLGEPVGEAHEEYYGKNGGISYAA